MIFVIPRSRFGLVLFVIPRSRFGLVLFVIPHSRFGLVLFVWVRCLVLAVGPPPPLPGGRVGSCLRSCA